jgi:hypothetical protein
MQRPPVGAAAAPGLDHTLPSKPGPRATFATGRIASCGNRRASSVSDVDLQHLALALLRALLALAPRLFSAMRKSSISLSFSLSLTSGAGSARVSGQGRRERLPQKRRPIRPLWGRPRI